MYIPNRQNVILSVNKPLPTSIDGHPKTAKCLCHDCSVLGTHHAAHARQESRLQLCARDQRWRAGAGPDGLVQIQHLPTAHAAGAAGRHHIDLLRPSQIRAEIIPTHRDFQHTSVTPAKFLALVVPLLGMRRRRARGVLDTTCLSRQRNCSDRITA